jgi:hypothetical protein
VTLLPGESVNFFVSSARPQPGTIGTLAVEPKVFTPDRELQVSATVVSDRKVKRGDGTGETKQGEED